MKAPVKRRVPLPGLLRAWDGGCVNVIALSPPRRVIAQEHPNGSLKEHHFTHAAIRASLQAYKVNAACKDLAVLVFAVPGDAVEPGFFYARSEQADFLTQGVVNGQVHFACLRQ